MELQFAEPADLGIISQSELQKINPGRQAFYRNGAYLGTRKDIDRPYIHDLSPAIDQL